MKTTRRLIVIGFCLVLLIGFSGLRATEERAAQEGVSCTTCHDKPGSALLTSKGKFYEYTGS
ncbi:MAG: hypothetical protein GWM88_07025, partial [Pseudomonadales bacterium]|nr:hypothetical protein [Pseudomonadales bacterium]NIX07771.1 hypothetical protein [Pseudomonadales bacterium]